MSASAASNWLVGRGFTLADMWLLPAVHNFCMHTGHTQLLHQSSRGRHLV